MFPIRPLIPLCACLLWFSVTAAVAQDGAANSRAAPQPARPAILIVPALGPLGHADAPQTDDVIRPPATPRADADPVPDGDAARARDRRYRLVQTVVPNPLWPEFRYHVYLDLSDPSAVRQWRELQHARRAEARAAVAERRAVRDMRQRKLRLLSAHELAVEEGLAGLRAGDYRAALIALTRAAELNHADPACRIHLAQAHMALGHDDEAAKALRRGLELQPRLAPINLDLQSVYPDPADFADEVDALAARLAARDDTTAEEQFLLGFMRFQQGRTDEAYTAFRLAARGLPKDDRVKTFLQLTRPAAR